MGGFVDVFQQLVIWYTSVLSNSCIISGQLGYNYASNAKISRYKGFCGGNNQPPPPALARARAAYAP